MNDNTVTVPVGWRVMKLTSRAGKRKGDRWEVYSPAGFGGVVNTQDVKDWVVCELLDALAAAPSSEGER